MATYSLRFHEKARKEWNKLGHDLQLQFQSKLAERVEHPRVPSAALWGMPDCYKIKLKEAGYRLVYRVDDDIIYVTAIAVGRRNKGKVYQEGAARRLKE
jgi:mRNA interferase RelE/StbE